MMQAFCYDRYWHGSFCIAAFHTGWPREDKELDYHSYNTGNMMISFLSGSQNGIPRYEQMKESI